MSSLTLMGAGPESGSAPFNPASVTGLVADWDFSTLVQADASPITSLADGSGSGNTITQGTGAQQPTFKTAIQNGRGVGRFDGTDDNLNAVGAILTAAPFTLFAVCAPTDLRVMRLLSNGRYMWGKGDATASTWFTTNAVLDYTDAGMYAAATWVVATCIFDAGFDAEQWKNGTSLGLVAGVADGAAATVGMKLGGRSTGVDFFAGDMGRILIYNAALSAANRQYVEAGLKTQWGTP